MDVIPTLGLVEDTQIELGDTVAVVFSVTAAPLTGLYLTPSATGLAFSPPTLFFAPGGLYAHATFTAEAPGTTQVTYALSGPDRLLYQVNSSVSTSVTVNPLSLSIGREPI